MRSNGAGPDKELSLAEALRGDADDPAIGPILEFRVVGQVESVDVPGYIHRATDADLSVVPARLTEQIPVLTPVRKRQIEIGRSGGGDSRGANGECVPDCADEAIFPWSIKVDGRSAHTFNANRISMLLPRPGEVEHWTVVNGGGWDHPMPLHFEEGLTLFRGRDGRDPIAATERLARKDVWRVGTTGDRSVTFQVQFGEYGGSYVQHCHNNVHEDFAMLMRMQVLSNLAGSPLVAVTATPNPTPDGVVFTTPEILPEADPRVRQRIGNSGSGRSG
jgi:FtsP/CotA-like multicopper oxidase with cupredoxin domain